MSTLLGRVGKRLRALRARRGWSQEKLAEQSDLHPTYIGGIERGLRNPSLLSLVKLARALNLSLAELLRIPGNLE
ncbi:MAG: XRE family transcriptional regulator [Nitrospirae bacterium]|nr:MAG: XRE family transcriptional regulator [Nitrospirota bacterium]